MRRSEKNQAANGVENVALSAASRIVASEYSIFADEPTETVRHKYYWSPD